MLLSKRFYLLALFITSLAPLALAIPSWEKNSVPGEFNSVIAHPLSDQKWVAASPRQIFESSGNENWKPVGKVQASGEIQKLLFFPEFSGAVFTLSPNAIQKVDLKDKRISKIYQIPRFSPHVLTFTVTPGNRHHWFLGTEKGLSESDDAGGSWYPFARFSREPVSVLKFARGKLFVCAGNSLYVSEDLAHFKKLLSLTPGEEETPEEIENQDFESEPKTGTDFFELAAPGDPSLPLWAAARTGVYESSDNGETWRLLKRSGLRGTEVRQLAFSVSQKKLFAGTGAGVYVYENQTWRELYQGMLHSKINGLALLEKPEGETLAAITSGGFFEYPLLPDHVTAPSIEINAGRLNLFHELTRLEPSANEIHNAVIRYCNLHNRKTRMWRWASRLSALVPSFSFGKDFSRGNNIDIDRAGTNEADKFIFGPDDLNAGWDMDIGWDLGNFLYSSDQTSIDSREKLMVELRNDMTAEATRIYFERRRLQVEILLKPAADEQEHLDRLLRVDELTSLLDGMTDGFMTKRVQQVYAAQPEFRELWEYSIQSPSHPSPGHQEKENGKGL